MINVAPCPWCAHVPAHNANAHARHATPRHCRGITDPILNRELTAIKREPLESVIQGFVEVVEARLRLEPIFTSVW